MDVRETPRPPPPTMMVGPTSYGSTNLGPNFSSSSAAAMLAPATARFPFGAVPPPQQHQPPPSSEPFPASAAYDGSSSPMKPCSLAKKKRGRPRKYSPDGSIALGLAPTHTSPPASAAAGGGSAGDSAGTASADAPAKKHRGRPPGSGKKQLDALGAGGVGFTPHVIMVESGEDITAKIMAFSQQGPRTVCILSAIGAIGNVTLRQPAMSGGIATYEVLCSNLKITVIVAEHALLNVTLAGSDGRVLGGGVAGTLTAASTVQVIVGSFIAFAKKSSSSALKSGSSSAPPPQMLTFGAPMTPNSPTSQGPSTESSEEQDHSPFCRGPGPGHGLYNNASQPVHNMPMYHHPLWAGQSHQ
uniref:AT-hook motif nuclear-localized protein n=1 Tax=Glycine max TaxID=3847 RepID=A0A0R0FLQ1_SOYBN